METHIQLNNLPLFTNENLKHDLNPQNSQKREKKFNCLEEKIKHSQSPSLFTFPNFELKQNNLLDYLVNPFNKDYWRNII